MAPSITNVIASCTLSTQDAEFLDLNYIAQKVEGSRYNVRKFAGLIIRKNNPKGTILIYKSLKFVIVGCSSVEDC